MLSLVHRGSIFGRGGGSLFEAALGSVGRVVEQLIRESLAPGTWMAYSIVRLGIGGRIGVGLWV